MKLHLYKNAPERLASIMCRLKNEGVAFWDYTKATDCLDGCTIPAYLKRYYAEVIFLNSFYLGWFNGARDIPLTAHCYGLTLQDCQSYIDLSRKVHNTIHDTLNSFKGS